MIQATLAGDPWEALAAAGAAIATTVLASKSSLSADTLGKLCDVVKGPAGIEGLTAVVNPKTDPTGYATAAKYVAASCTGISTAAQAAAARAAAAITNPGGTAVGAIPAGSITALSPSGVWLVAAPSPYGSGYTIIGSAAAPAPGATVVDYATFQKRTGTLPWYKNPLILAGVGAGTLVFLGTVILLVKK